MMFLWGDAPTAVIARLDTERGCSRVLALLNCRKSETSDFQNSGVPEFWHF
jgi:hypothetical protein